MFYYLSFLRPPPVHVPLSTRSITITPQISNDLRTELLDTTQDIFYAWSLCSSPSSPPADTTPSTKLTSWRQSSAYKEISVPLPRDAREGQSWRLILTAKPTTLPHISLDDSSMLGEVPFPIVSMPIQILSSLGKPTGGKQEQVERIYRLHSEPESFLTIREKTSFDLDKKVWDSGIGLSSWIVALARNELSPDAPPLLVQAKKTLITSECGDVIELGAGTGIASLTLGAVRSSIHHTPNAGNIFITDLPSAMPLLSHNIAANEPLFSTPSSRPLAFPLDWDDTELPPQVQKDSRGFDMILMADVTYNTSSFPSLLRTVSSLINHTTIQSKPPPLIVLGYKERDSDERSLWSAAKHQQGIHFEQVGEYPGKGGTPVEFWIGTTGLASST